MIRILRLLVLFCLIVPSPALAAKDSERRQELAEKMNDLRPASLQVNTAIEQIAQQWPEGDRTGFMDYMKRNLDYRAIEKISIDAMAETFTLEELEAMVEYYSKPEAISASEKLPDYQEKVSPQITRMIDKVLMKARTGGTGP